MKRHHLRTASDHLSSCFVDIYFIGAFTQTPAVWLSLSLLLHFSPRLIVMNNFVHIKLVFLCVSVWYWDQRCGFTEGKNQSQYNEEPCKQTPNTDTRVSMNVVPVLEATVNSLPKNTTHIGLPRLPDTWHMTQHKHYGYVSFSFFSFFFHVYTCGFF